MREPTPQETYDAIIASGALSYWYYLGAHTEGKASAISVADDWKTTVLVVDPDDTEVMTQFTVTHAEIIAACREIAAMRIPNTSAACDSQAHNLCYTPDFADFDAHTADEVIQTIAFGAPVFG